MAPVTPNVTEAAATFDIAHPGGDICGGIVKSNEQSLPPKPASQTHLAEI